VKRLRSLQGKLIVSFLLVTLIPLTASGLYGHFFTNSALSAQALERSIYQVHLQAESIMSALRQVQGDALYLSALRSLNMLRQQSEAEQVSLWRQEVGQDLLVLASVRPMYRAIRVLDSNGVEWVGVHSSDQQVSFIGNLQDRSSTSYFQETMALPVDGIYVSPFHSEDAIGAPYIHYAIRLTDGVLVIDLHAGWVLRALPTQSGEDSWALIDQGGRFLVYPEGFDTRAVAADLSAMLTGGRDYFQTDDSVYAFDTIYPTPDSINANNYWVIFRHTPTEVLYTSIYDFYHVVVLFVILAILVALGLALLISRILVEPVRDLQTMTITFGQEGKAPRMPNRLPGDEIGALTRTFIQMANELEGKRRQEHRLIERLIHAQEEERKLVAYDLHDGLIQQMVGARFYLNNTRDICRQYAPEVMTYIHNGCEALSEAIVEGRRIIEGLRPAALDDLGLTAAIEEIAAQTARAAGWQLDLMIEALHYEPEKTVGVTLYRITQEALNNARKHARASTVKIRLHNGSGIHLTVEDDGIGFDLAEISRDGHGLGITTMQERASLINGTCEIISSPGTGTYIDVCVPFALAHTNLGENENAAVHYD